MYKNIRVSFYVTGSASRLVELIKSDSPILKSTHFVLNDGGHNLFLLEELAKREIEYIEFDYLDLSIQKKEEGSYVSQLLLHLLNDNLIDYMFCFGSRILKGDILVNYQNRIINFHPSLLPSFPGINSIDQALNAGALIMGNTAHFIDSGIDTGPIIMQSVIHLTNFKNYTSLLDMQLKMIEQIFIWLKEGRIHVDRDRVEIINAKYDVGAFYPNIES